MSPASLQTFIDKPNCVLEDRDQLAWSTFRTYSLMKLFKTLYFACFCTVIVRCTETFWSPYIIARGTYNYPLRFKWFTMTLAGGREDFSLDNSTIVTDFFDEIQSKNGSRTSLTKYNQRMGHGLLWRNTIKEWVVTTGCHCGALRAFALLGCYVA